MSKLVYRCGVPEQHCKAATMQSTAGMKHSVKVHSSTEEAFKCYAKYLIEVLGYTRVGKREFAAPDGGPIRVLTKPSKFGGAMRKGKGGEGQTGRRVMPKRRHGGVIISE